jgi:hypothetical protein
MRSLSFSAVLLLAATPLFAQDTTTAKPAALAWGPAPAIFPSGAQMAVVSGDPGKAAPFVVALKMPAGYRIPLTKPSRSRKASSLLAWGIPSI